MDFISFLTDYFKSIDFHNPQVICIGLLVLFMGVTRRFLLIGMTFCTVVLGKMIEYYVPESTSAFVGDLSMVQVVYIVASIIIVITGIGQVVLRH